jgi:hypothetical protein
MTSLVQIAAINVFHTPLPKSWRLTQGSVNSNEYEELVLSIQGIITNKNLPPVIAWYGFLNSP